VNHYISAKKITVPVGANNRVAVGPGGVLTLEISSLEERQTQMRDEYIVSESRSYFDDAGNLSQNQSRILSSKTPEQDYSEAQVLVSQPLWGQYRNTVGQTLPAPVGTGGFRYVPDFVTANGVPYNHTHFDTNEKINNPAPVDASSPLGRYYSNQNTQEPYVPASAFPYSRSEMYDDGSGEMKRAAGVGEELRMGRGRESYSNAFPVGNELDHYLRVRRLLLPDAENNPATFAKIAVKQVSIDVNGREAVSFADKSGKAIATCLAGEGFTEQTFTCKTDVSLPLYWANNSRTLDFSGASAFLLGVVTFSIDITGNGQVQVYDTDNGGLIYEGTAKNLILPQSFNASHYNPQTQKFIANLQVRSLEPISVVFKETYNVENGPLFLETEQETKSFVNTSVPVHIPNRKAATAVTVTQTGVASGASVRTENRLSEGTLITETAGAFSRNGSFYMVSLGGKTLSSIPVQTDYSGTVTLSYPYPTANWNYSFYNDAGQLVATIAPEGVKAIWNAVPTEVSAIPFLTRYEYDLQGRLIAQTETDAGRTEYVYRRDGQLRFSQNAVQRNATPKRFSYVNYDTYGRAVESGEFEPVASSLSFSVQGMPDAVVESTASNGSLTDGTRKDWVRSHFDEAPWAVPDEWETYVPDYTYGKLAASENANAKTWYSYDEQGRMEWMLQDIKGLGAKMVEYTYDLAGNVLKVAYQKGKPDAFYHYYAYDDDLRLKTVHTSRNGLSRELQATYHYYLHGPLKRVELADKLQGIDYVYTIQGWLKSINHPDKAHDPGKDGTANTANAAFAPDAFGLQLDYFSGDYIRSNTSIASFNTIGNTTTPVPSLYSGHIATQTWFTQKSTGAIAVQGAQINAPQSATYQYDNRYQLTQATFATPDFANRTLQLQEKYKEYGMTYDWHGNLKSLKRNDANGALKDDFTYNYQLNTNQLQNVSSYRSYQYDQMGQMSAEIGNGQANYLEYDANGKVRYLYKDATRTQLKAGYDYTDGGDRYKKTEYENGGGITYSVYGRSGLLATYVVKNGATALSEVPVHGLGMYYEDSKQTVYELSNHTGNVLAIIGRSKTNGQADVLSYNDFTAMGLPVGEGGDQNYGYGYQGAYSGQDEQTGWNNFELRMYDSRIGRWLSTDPYQQYWSPYVGMGNDWINGVDPDGGETEWKPDGKGNLIAEKGDNLETLYAYFKGEKSMDELASLMGNLKNWDGGTSQGILLNSIENHKLNILPLFTPSEKIAIHTVISILGTGEYIADNLKALWSLTTPEGRSAAAEGMSQTSKEVYDRSRYLRMMGHPMAGGGNAFMFGIGHMMGEKAADYAKSVPTKTSGELAHDVGYGAMFFIDLIYGPKALGAAKETVMTTKAVQTVIKTTRRAGAYLKPSGVPLLRSLIGRAGIILDGLKKTATALNQATVAKLAGAVVKKSDNVTELVIHFENGKYYAYVEEPTTLVETANKMSQRIDLSTTDLADFIRKAGLEGTGTIRLSSCNKIEDAVELSRQISNPIEATDGLVLLHPDGGITTIPREPGGSTQWYRIENGQKTPIAPPQTPASQYADEFMQMGGEDLLGRVKQYPALEQKLNALSNAIPGTKAKFLQDFNGLSENALNALAKDPDILDVWSSGYLISNDVFALKSAKVLRGAGIGLREATTTEAQRLTQLKQQLPVQLQAQNVAEATIDGIPGLPKNNYPAHSGYNQGQTLIPGGSPPPKEANRIFTTTEAPTANGNYQFRSNDSEVKILEDVAKDLGAKKGDIQAMVSYPAVEGKITIKTYLCPCESCSRVIKQFKTLFPNVEVEVVYLYPSVSN
jgi:RHS repeat-associated protein